MGLPPAARSIGAAFLAAAVVVGCGRLAPLVPSPEATPTPSPPSASPEPTPTPRVVTPSQAPVPPTPPPAPPNDLETTTTIERDGIRVTVTLQRNPMPAGEPTWADTVVTNVGTDNVTWFHDGCATPVYVWGTMPGAGWPPGREHPPRVQPFKDRLVDYTIPESMFLRFGREDRVGRIGGGCADIGIADTIPPGGSVQQRRVWDGTLEPRLGLPPAGPVEIGIQADFYWRGDEEPESIVDQSITGSMEAWVVGGRDPAMLAPTQIIDAALANRPFADLIATKNLGNGMSEVLWYWPERDVWEVGVLEYAPRRIVGIEVDPRTGSFIRTFERPWNPDVDGYP
jgi:hypothetical protein